MNSRASKSFIQLSIYFTRLYCTRVRFAPSPTGLMHVGGLKTAFVNFLFAKSTNGNLILRIEDTDRSRFDYNSIDHILKVCNWLDIKFNEGVVNNEPHPSYIQSNRLHLYRKAVDHLLRENKAYRCFCSNKRLEFLRKEQTRQGESVRYDRKCLHLTQAEINQRLLQQSNCAIRFKLDDDCQVDFHDEIFGRVEVSLSNAESDPIILKSDGFPVYHLANVVDDHEMGITHVIRGQEWLVSTPKHVVLYKAFGWNPPIFAHLPLILKDNGMKISKRDPDFIGSYYNIDSLIGKGFMPDVVRSWLMSCGGGLNIDWYPQITLEQMIDQFSISRITTHNAKLSQDLLEIAGRSHMNGIQISQNYFDQNIKPFLARNSINLEYNKFCNIFQQMKHRLVCLGDMKNFSYIWSHTPTCIEDLINAFPDESDHVAKADKLKELFHRFIVALQTTDDPILQIKNSHESLCNRSVALKCFRMAIINRTEGPQIAELVSMIPRKELINRLNSTITAIQCYNKNDFVS